MGKAGNSARLLQDTDGTIVSRGLQIWHYAETHTCYRHGTAEFEAELFLSLQVGSELA